MNHEFQMFKLNLEKGEEPEIQLSTFVGSSKKHENSWKKYISDLLTTPKPWTVWIITNCGKFFKIWEHQTTLSASWEICRTRHGTTDWFKIGKGVCHGYILSPYLFDFCAKYIMWNARLDESQAGIKIGGRNINNLSYVDGITLMAESEEEL